MCQQTLTGLYHNEVSVLEELRGWPANRPPQRAHIPTGQGSGLCLCVFVLIFKYLLLILITINIITLHSKYPAQSYVFGVFMYAYQKNANCMFLL